MNIKKPNIFLEEPIHLICSFCNKNKDYTKFHYGTINETTPLICIKCLNEGKVKRTYKKF